MKYAIIAAGEGSRLAAEGIETPKPLVEVGGEKLIDRLLRVFVDNGATEIAVICNEFMHQVAVHLGMKKLKDAAGNDVPLRLKIKSTPSSMHSFYELSKWLDGGPFCLTTVDTIFREKEFSGYIAEFRKALENGGCDGLMGVTDYIDDEKPLYVDTAGDLSIRAFLDPPASCRFISGGIYGLTPASFEVLRACIGRGESRMRNFQRALIKEGLNLRAYPFSKVLDIDHATDIVKAREFLGK